MIFLLTNVQNYNTRILTKAAYIDFNIILSLFHNALTHYIVNLRL